MSSRVERTFPAKKIENTPVIVDFDAARLKAPFALRCGAILIDYILLIIVPVASILLGRFFELDGTRLLNGSISSTGWLIMILLALTNFFIFPLLTGQSIGKMLTGLKVVGKNGNEPTLGSLLVRHLIGYPLIILTGGLGFLISALNQKGRALHDFLAGTVVIYGQRKIQNSK